MNKPQVRRECLVLLDSGSSKAGSCQVMCIPSTQLYSDTRGARGSARKDNRKMLGLLVLAKLGQHEEMGLGHFGKEWGVVGCQNGER